MSPQCDSGNSNRLKKVHKFLDAKIQFLWWELDEIYILCGPIILGILVNRVIYGLLFALVAGKIYSSIKSVNQEGYLLHFLYHHGMLKFKNCPDSWVKEMTE